MDSLHQCKRCGVPQPRSAYGDYIKPTDEIKRICDGCYQAQRKSIRKKYHQDNKHVSRAGSLMSLYGLSLDAYETMHLEQNGLCAICGRPETEAARGGVVKRLSVDHDHRTGRIRGLLCAKCNQAIGSMSEDTERLKAAADYLEDNSRTCWPPPR